MSDRDKLLDALRVWIAQRPGLEYSAGQYWPTEYRAAVCAGLALALWRFWRECGSTPRIAANREFGRGPLKGIMLP